jgi:hypothetical protein
MTPSTAELQISPAPPSMPKPRPLDAEMARGEIKEWTNRCLLVLPMQFALTAALTDKSILDTSNSLLTFLVVFVLGLAFVVLARLSRYCTNAIATGEGYLQQHHGDFWKEYSVCQFGERDLLARYHLTYCIALAIGIVSREWAKDAHPYVALCGAAACALTWFLLWLLGKPARLARWSRALPVEETYRDTWTKCLRDEIVAWQTRRFALLTAVLAMLAVAVKGWKSSGVNPYSLSALLVFAAAASYVITERAGTRNDNASNVLKRSLHWESEIKRANLPRSFRPTVTLNKLALGCYWIVGLAALVFSALQLLENEADRVGLLSFVAFPIAGMIAGIERRLARSRDESTASNPSPSAIGAQS